MSLSPNPDVLAAIEPPIAEAQSWIAGRTFPFDKPLLDLAQAVPSYPPAEDLRRHLAERVMLFETAQYSAIRGILPLRASLARHMSERYVPAAGGDAMGADDLLITAGCNQAFCLAISALARAGDEVILPVPYYFNHQMWLEMQGIGAVHLPFRADRAGVPDPADAARLITAKTRAIVLVSPNNPTGAIYPPAVFAAFRDLARDAGIALVCDETYKDFLDDGAGPPHALFEDPAWRDTVVQLYSFSKAFSLTGYRAGSILAGPEVIRAATKIMDTVQICTPRIAQDAALYGLEHLWPWVAEKREMIAERRRALEALFRANDLGFELISAGAYFSYVRHPHRGVPAKAVARRLADEQNVLCLPGSFFGPGQEDCLRLAFANAPVERMPELGDRLRAIV
jgi:aspartate/methionine/tyrosine aminotransferase